MLNRIFKSGLIGFFALVMITAFTSCQKEKETIGIIIVKDSNGTLVPNADVILSPEQVHNSGGELPDPSLTKGPKQTDSNGRVEFTYDLEAILNVEVTYLDGNITYTGVDIIRLQKGKTITEEVEIN